MFAPDTTTALGRKITVRFDFFAPFLSRVITVIVIHVALLKWLHKENITYSMTEYVHVY